MSLSEKYRHQRKGEGKVRSLIHKYDGRKIMSVVNHNHFTRNHGFESTKHPGAKELPSEP